MLKKNVFTPIDGIQPPTTGGGTVEQTSIHTILSLVSPKIGIPCLFGCIMCVIDRSKRGTWLVRHLLCDNKKPRSRCGALYLPVSFNCDLNFLNRVPREPNHPTWEGRFL